jgi:ABC-2 type transport system ATP-binding protein
MKQAEEDTRMPERQADAAADALIRAEGLSKYYGTFTAVRDIGFRVGRGSIAAFLGPNGAGKSTTLRILTGFLAPSEGRAWIAGHDMATDRIAGSRQMGYLGENGPLYPDMSPAAYLRYVGRVRNLPAGELSAAMERVADACVLREVWGKPIHKLSKGFRQRVGLAAAMLHDPQVLILDEPTAGLDPNQIRVVRELIRNFARQDRAVLLSTHILQEVEAIADHVLLVSEGRLRFDGSPKELAGSAGLEARFRELTKGVAA